jgi:RecB family exonuclease
MAQVVVEQVRTGGRERVGAIVVDGVEVVGSLSPSRAADFMSCPLLYRFRTIDKLPEEPSPAAVRGTVVHKVLEELFDLPAPDRTRDRAGSMLEPAWEALLAEDPSIADMFPDDTELGPWLVSCRETLQRYFELEDPRRLEPAERELYVETLLDSKLLLRGFVDRLDVAPAGQVRVVDYKGLALDTPLPTPDGWTTMRAVEVGDHVFGSDGRPTRVTVKSEVHRRPCYRVTFRDGSSVVCDNVHLWTVVTSSRQRQSTRTVATDELHELHRRLVGEGRRDSLWVSNAAELELADAADLPVDPWLLGAWLGDGDTRGSGFTVGQQDTDDMVTKFKEQWPRLVRQRREGRSTKVTLSALPDRCSFGHTEFRPATPGHRTRRCLHEHRHASMEPWNVSFTAALRRAGLCGRKHIPAVYLRAGRNQRIDLLRGLMDTDGWWNKTRRRAGFTTTNDDLAFQVVELLRTLGINPQHFVKPYTNAARPDRSWHIIEFTPLGFNPFALPRKAAAAESGVTDLQRTLSSRRIIESVEPVESVPTQCIAVDAPDSLYLCGRGFVPTHNTGRSPSPYFEAKALFQMKFYALVLWRLRGTVPDLLQLMYLGNSEVLRYVPEERDLLAVERKLEAIWKAISRAAETGDWRPNRTKLCDWCSHQALCPEFGGTPPPLPEVTRAQVADPGMAPEDTA